jgi:hypothetical protein
MLLMANAGVVHATAEDAPQTWRRFVVYLIQAYAEEAASPLPPAPSPKRMHRAFLRAGY